jgi:hypothetical protein
LPNPREWAKRLPGGSSIEGAIARTAGAWPIVMYWVASSGRATPKVRLPRLTPGAWDGLGLTRPVDLTALDYALRLNPRLAEDADRGTLARRMMLLSRARLALDLGGTGNKGGDMWTLWTLADDEAAVIHRSRAGSDRSPTAVAAFVRTALGYDGAHVAARSVRQGESARALRRHWRRAARRRPERSRPSCRSDLVQACSCWRRHPGH